MEGTSENIRLPTEWCQWLKDEVEIMMRFAIRTRLNDGCEDRPVESFQVLSVVSFEWL